jgi:hypothetical protein
VARVPSCRVGRLATALRASDAVVTLLVVLAFVVLAAIWCLAGYFIDRHKRDMAKRRRSGQVGVSACGRRAAVRCAWKWRGATIIEQCVFVDSRGDAVCGGAAPLSTMRGDARTPPGSQLGDHPALSARHPMRMIRAATPASRMSVT